MPAGGHLTELMAAKYALRRRIAARRVANAALVARVAGPFLLLDFLWNLWRSVAPLISPSPREGAPAPRRSIWRRLWRELWRWSPAVASVLRDVRRVAGK